MTANDMGPFQDIVNVHWNTGAVIVIQWRSTFQSDGSQPQLTPDNGRMAKIPQLGPSVEYNILAGPNGNIDGATEFYNPFWYNVEDTGTAPALTQHHDHYEYTIEYDFPTNRGTGHATGGGTIDVFIDGHGNSSWSVGGGFLTGTGTVDDAVDALFAHFAAEGSTITSFSNALISSDDTTYTGGTFFVDEDTSTLILRVKDITDILGESEDHIEIDIDSGDGPVVVDNVPTFYNYQVTVGYYDTTNYRSFPVDSIGLPVSWPPFTAQKIVAGSGNNSDAAHHHRFFVNFRASPAPTITVITT